LAESISKLKFAAFALSSVRSSRNLVGILR
jgi:hypothetical protein